MVESWFGFSVERQQLAHTFVRVAFHSEFMTKSHDELLQQLNEMQAVRGIEGDTRNVIGMLGETITTLGEEIDVLQQRVNELEERVDEIECTDDDGEQRKQAWYSER